MRMLLDTNFITVYLYPKHHHWFVTARHICIGPVEIMLRYWFINRATWRLIGRLLWTIPRLRDEYAAYQKQAWDRGNCAVAFSEWIAWRIFPEKVGASK